jgi:hypothetical protein
VPTSEPLFRGVGVALITLSGTSVELGPGTATLAGQVA